MIWSKELYGAILNTTIIPYRLDEVLNHQGTCNYTHGHTKLVTLIASMIYEHHSSQSLRVCMFLSVKPVSLKCYKLQV